MVIEFINVSYTYEMDSPWESVALRDIDLRIDDGEFVGLIGPTGSGKSTLVQHMNGLLQPTSGQVLVDGIDLRSSKKHRRRIRQEVGLIFQYPEHQLFEETVARDVAFGPSNQGLDESEVDRRVEEALHTVGLDPEEFGPRSPFNLSGGQKRRVAIAGVLAMRPDVLVLDEPTAGLDPQGSRQIMETIRQLHEKSGRTVILVSHNMIDVARLARRVVVMAEQRVVLDGPVEHIFGHEGDRLREMGLDIPPVTAAVQALRRRGAPLPAELLTVEDTARAIDGWLRSRKHA